MTNFRLTYLLFGIVFSGAATAVYFFAIDPESISWGLLIFTFLFGGVGVVFLIAFIHSIIAGVKNNKIEQFGRNGTGTYLKHKEVLSSNEVPYHRIYFSFKNDSGKIVETKTRGGGYRRYEAEAFAIMQTFPIRYLGDKAIIRTDKQTLLEVFYDSRIKELKEKAIGYNL